MKKKFIYLAEREKLGFLFILVAKQSFCERAFYFVIFDFGQRNKCLKIHKTITLKSLFIFVMTIQQKTATKINIFNNNAQKKQVHLPATLSRTKIYSKKLMKITSLQISPRESFLEWILVCYQGNLRTN